MIFLIRFFTGYVVFKITGSRAGSFINELNRRRINVWGVRARAGEIYCRVSRSDYPEVQRLCRGTSQRVHISAKRGVPFILHKNRRRGGLIAGAVLFAVIFKALSAFVWVVDMCSLDTLSQTSAREILRRVGIYEGVRADFESLKRMQTTAMLEFGGLSWITINVDGSRGEVNATEKTPAETNDTAPRDMIASHDGQIIRIDAYSGAPAVNAGDGVIKGDVLISSAVETELGGVHFERADGIAFARTHRTERIEIPKTREVYPVTGEPAQRYSAHILGLYLPLSAARVEESSVIFPHELQAEFFGERASAALIKETAYPVEKTAVVSDRADADELFETRALLCELFSYSDRTIISRTHTVTETPESFIFTVDYICEENIASPWDTKHFGRELNE